MRPELKGYLRSVATSAAVIAACALLGYLPTRHLAGGDVPARAAESLPGESRPAPALPGVAKAMAAGCLVGLLAGAAGALPIARAGSSPEAKLGAALRSIGVRFAAVLALGLAAYYSGRFARGPLLAWIGISYAVGLVIDSRYAASVLNPRL